MASPWQKVGLQTLDARQRLDAFLVACSPTAKRLLVRIGTYPDVALAIVDRATGQISASQVGTHQVAHFVNDESLVIAAQGKVLRGAAPSFAMTLDHALSHPRSPHAIAVARDGTRCAILSTFRNRGRIETVTMPSGASELADDVPYGVMAAMAYVDDTHELRTIGSLVEPIGPLVEWRRGRGATPITKEAPFACALSSDGSTIALVEAAPSGALLRMLDPVNRTRLTVALPDDSHVKLSLSADGSRLALTHVATGALLVFDAGRQGPPIFEYTMCPDERRFVSQAHLSPDGTTVIWARRTLAEWRVAKI